jgi:thioredoxin 1
MSKTVHVQSLPHLQALIASNSYLVLDFYADWCGPCHAIAPFYEQLSNNFSAENGIAFGKVNVDVQRDVAQRYQITAMPTFVVIKDGNVVESIRGANPPALKNAVTKAAGDLAKLAEEKKRKEQQQQQQASEAKNDTTVSGGYTLNTGSNWRMSLT